MIGDKEQTEKRIRITEKFIREAFKAYVTPTEAARLVRLALFRAREDNGMLKFVLEQVFGKAHESVALGNPDGSPLTIHISEAVALRNKLKVTEAEYQTDDPLPSSK